MKKVAHYKAGIYLPLTENWIYSQLINLRKYQPIVYCYNADNFDIYPTQNVRPLRWIFLNRVWNKIFNFYPVYIFYLLKDKPDLIHAHFGPSGYEFLKLKQALHLPLITSFYGQDLSMLPARFPKWEKRYKQLFEKGDCFLIEGNYMKQSLVKLGCPKEKIIVQHLGIDLDKIKFRPRRISANKEIKILISASFREKKGIPYAVEAFGMVKQKNPRIKLKLTIIGDSSGDPEGEEQKQAILKKIAKYNLEDYTRLLGYQPHSILIKEFYKHHVFISPSIIASSGDTEGGMPVTIIEASASGMPVLSTKHCDIPEVILNTQSGYLVPEKNVHQLAERLSRLVSNPGIWQKFGRTGRKHIEKNYDLKKQVIKLEKIYDSLLA